MRLLCHKETTPSNAPLRPSGARYDPCCPLCDSGRPAPAVALRRSVLDTTRIPYGHPLSAPTLARIPESEAFLHKLGLHMVRVRAHGNLARVEVAEDDLIRALLYHESVVQRLRELGFRYVTLDLAGYRQGSMNEGLP